MYETEFFLEYLTNPHKHSSHMNYGQKNKNKNKLI